MLCEPALQWPFWKREGGQLVPMVELEKLPIRNILRTDREGSTHYEVPYMTSVNILLEYCESLCTTEKVILKKINPGKNVILS